MRYTWRERTTQVCSHYMELETLGQCSGALIGHSVMRAAVVADGNDRGFGTDGAQISNAIVEAAFQT